MSRAITPCQQLDYFRDVNKKIRASCGPLSPSGGAHHKHTLLKYYPQQTYKNMCQVNLLTSISYLVRDSHHSQILKLTRA